MIQVTAYNNIYRHGNRFFRLCAKDITPNNCYLIGAEYRQVDIDIATGEWMESGLVIDADSIAFTKYEDVCWI